MRHRVAVGLAIVTSAFTCATSAVADTATCSLKDVSVIQDGRGNTRVLFNFVDPGTWGWIAISRATLRFDLAGVPSSGVSGIRVHPINRTWSPGATWTSGWTKAGGDFEEDVYSRAEIDLSQTGRASVDVTPLLKEMLEGGAATYGFLITADSGARAGLTAVEAARLGTLLAGSLEVKYRKMPPMPARARAG